MKLLWLCNMVPGKVKEAVSGGSELTACWKGCWDGKT